MPYTPTPAASTLRDPTDGDLETYQDGTDRFLHLAEYGGFRNFDVASISADPARFNCFAWSVGFTDRWIQGGTKEDMVRLYQAYMFRQCAPAQAEVELYAINGAPAQLSRTIPGRPARPARNGRPAVAAIPARVVNYANSRALVMHAHRRDFPTLDNPPNRGCSSKLAAGPLIAHNRYALTDNRNWGAGAPQIVYGAIYECWERDPTAHPSFQANQANAYPAPGHYPDDRIYDQGYGTYPPGHPGNTMGLQPPAGNNAGGTGNTTTLARRPASSASSASTTTNSTGGHSRNSSNTSNSSGGSVKTGAAGKRPAAPPPKPWVFVAASGKSYSKIPLVGPYARVPAASAAAVTAATKAAGALNVKGNESFLKSFSLAWAAFVAAWSGHLARSPFCDDASVCMQTREFGALVGLANSKTIKAVIALVVHRLATEPKSFVGVYVYNYLERNPDYLVYHYDLFNYNVLQRHANLIVEMNSGRK